MWGSGKEEVRITENEMANAEARRLPAGTDTKALSQSRWQHGLLAIAAGALLSLPAGATGTEWTPHINPAPVIGADGQSHEATCSAFLDIDSTFSFWTKQGTSKNLVVFFEGGGACYDSFTCSFPIVGLPPEVPQLYVPAIAPTTDPANFDGIFNLSNPANPVKDWSFVYIPYCTGDLHLGSATEHYFSVGSPQLPVPGTPFTIEHRGFDNFMVVLDWITKNVSAPKNILVAGSSAGGYGASANFPWIAEAFPDAHMYVIADSSQGVSTDTWDASKPGRLSWNPMLPPWVYGNNPSLVAGEDLLRIAAEAYPQAKVAQFTTNRDNVQILFYDLMKQFYPPGGTCPDPAVDWNGQMLTTLKSYATDLGNFRFYLAGGSYHMIMEFPHFYTESSAGVAYSTWVGAMLESRGGFGGGGWRDAACPTCRVSPQCQ
jgi:hypothetical protein